MKVGDLVKMRQGYPAIGILVGIHHVDQLNPGSGGWDGEARWVTVHWADEEISLEKMRDLVAINESR